MLNVLVILILLLVAALFFFLAVRAGRSRRALVMWPGLFFAGLLGLLFLAVGGVAAVGEYQLNVAPHRYTVSDVQVAGTPEQIARGERIAYICADCHSTTGVPPLDGSKGNMFGPDAPPIGELYGANLTPGGSIKDWSDGEVMRAIREGIGKDGRPLFGMTSEPFHNLSDEDVQAVVAYLRSQPAVQRDLPRRKLNVLASLFVGAGLAPTSSQLPITAPVVAPQPGTVEYGKYLVDSVGCRDCHGPDLTGPTNPFVPPGPNLTVLMPNWGEEQFINFFQSGVDNTGRKIDTKQMPWETYSRVFSDAELMDIYAYLHGLPVVEKAK